MFETAAVIYFEMNRSSPLHGFSTEWTKLMTRPAARPNQSGADSAVARPTMGILEPTHTEAVPVTAEGSPTK
jgi:hypothetical protein